MKCRFCDDEFTMVIAPRDKETDLSLCKQHLMYITRIGNRI